MAYESLRLPIYALLVIVLLYNLSQRKHLEHGERKRFASLKIAGLVLLFAVELFLIEWFKLDSLFILPATAIVVLLGYLMRRGFSIYRVRCGNCNRRLSLTHILYHDNPLCPACAESKQTLDEAGEKTTQFPGGVPRTVDEIDWDTWRPDETAVLCFVRRGDEVLLIRKKTGLGAGKINGPGGRIEPGESAEEAAIRETQEETGITPRSLEYAVELRFVFTNGYSLQGSVFFASDFTGTPAETREADPFWCRIAEIPYDRMWEDDREWLPRALEGEKLDARFIFEEDLMLSQRIVRLSAQEKNDTK